MFHNALNLFKVDGEITLDSVPGNKWAFYGARAQDLHITIETSNQL